MGKRNAEIIKAEKKIWDSLHTCYTYYFSSISTDSRLYLLDAKVTPVGKNFDREKVLASSSATFW